MSVKFRSLYSSTSKTVGHGLRNVQKKFVKCQTAEPLLWVGVPYRKNLIEPYILKTKNVTGETYQNFPFRRNAIPKLRMYPEDTIFRQEDSPPHFSVPLGQCLDQMYANLWIGSWLHSITSSLTAFDALWLHVMERFETYCTLQTSQRNIRARTRITNAVAIIDENCLKNVY